MKRDVFISYSRKNYATVVEIKRQIDTATDADCWMDLKEIESGAKRFTKAIVEGIDNCKVFFFMLSAESQQSPNALKELNYAEETGKHIVLVNIVGCKMEKEFLFNYGLTDTILWSDKLQREKLLRDISKWIGAEAARERREREEHERREKERKEREEKERTERERRQRELERQRQEQELRRREEEKLRQAKEKQEQEKVEPHGESVPWWKKWWWVVVGVVAVVACVIALSGGRDSSVQPVYGALGIYVDLGLASGTIWKDTNEFIGDTDLFSYDQAIQFFGDEIPTKEQWEELQSSCEWEWTGDGYKVTGPNGNSIFLSASGYRNCSGEVYNVGSIGNYWSSSDGSEGAWSLYVNAINMYMNYDRQCLGLSVRLVQD